MRDDPPGSETECLLQHSFPHRPLPIHLNSRSFLRVVSLPSRGFTDGIRAGMDTCLVCELGTDGPLGICFSL